MTMTPDAKRSLSTTIRGLRARLLDDLHAATEATYRLSVPAGEAELPEAETVRRQRLETWLGEQVRAQAGSKKRRTADDFRGEVEKQAAYTLLNRLIILRLPVTARTERRHAKPRSGCPRLRNGATNWPISSRRSNNVRRKARRPWTASACLAKGTSASCLTWTTAS